ncbi:MAG: hypothetical protein ABI823_14625, partial [Bryobacteraceae bacterium]
ALFGGADLIDLTSPVLRNYDLSASIGPVTTTPSFVGACPGIDCTTFQTSLGALNLSSVSTVTYQAVVGNAPPVISSVTEPASSSNRLSPGMPVQIAFLPAVPSGSIDPIIVTIGGKAAPRPQAVNGGTLIVQIPVETPVGATTVTLSVGGAVSPPFNITLDQYAPAIFPVTDLNGVAISPAHPAVPNTRISLTALGLGPTNPPMITDQAAAGTSPTTLPVQVSIGNKLIVPDYAGLLAGSKGSYQVTFKVSSDVPPGNQPLTVSVAGKISNSVTVAVAPPFPVISAIVNGATFKSTPSAPNSFVSIFGANFGSKDTDSNIFPATSLDGTSVLINGSAVPLYFVFGSLGQINLVLPSDLPESGGVNVQVKTSQGVSDVITIRMAPSDTGLFRIPDPSNAARNNGAILFANSVWRAMPVAMAKALGFPDCGADPLSICAQPARIGDALVIFLTGLGKATPGGDPAGRPLPSGTIAPVDGSTLYTTTQKPVVTVGGVRTEVLFSGITPGNAGLYQINIVVPNGVSPGDNVPIVVTMPDGSNDTVTVAIRP